MKKLKTKLDIVLFISTVKACTDAELMQLVHEYRNGEYEIV